MTWSAKTKDLIRPGLALVALIPFFFACNDPSRLGVELDNDNAKIQTESISFTLPASTVYIDSLRTDDDGSLVFGSIQNDQTFGNLTALAYTEYGYQKRANDTLPADSLNYSRCYLRLQVEKIWLGDESGASKEMNIYMADDSLFNSVRYHANMHTPYGSEAPIASVNESLNLSNDTIINIPLSDEYGQKLFEQLKESASPNDAEKIFNLPLVFEPGANNGALITFDWEADTAGIYVEMVNDSLSKIYDIKFQFTGKSYSEIIRDRSSGVYADLVNNYDSTTAHSFVHLNTIAGLHPRLDLAPYLDFLDTAENIIINAATLNMAEQSSSEIKPAIDWVQYFFANGGRANGAGALEDQVLNVVLSNDGYLSDLLQQRVTLSDILTTPFNSDDVNYVNDITFFVQRLLENKLTDVNYLTRQLILFSPDETSVGQSSFMKSDIILKVYYTKLN